MSTTTNTTYDNLQNPQNVKPASEEQTGYVQQAMSGATGIFNSAANTVSSYLPTSVTGATTQTQEGTTATSGMTGGVGGHPGQPGGVGDLGTDAQTDVVRLPDERADTGPLQGAAGAAYRSGVVGFGSASTDPELDTFASPNTTTTTTTSVNNNYTGKTLQADQFDGLEKIRPESSGTISAQQGQNTKITNSATTERGGSGPDLEGLDKIQPESSGTKKMDSRVYGSDDVTLPPTQDQQD